MSMQQIAGRMTKFAGLLAGRHLTAVAIVDDAYDDWWTQDIRPDEADELWSLIENSPEASEVLAEHGPEVKSANDITAELLKNVSLAAGGNGDFVQIVENSEFRKRVGTKTSTVTAIQGQMMEQLGLQVLTQGTRVTVKDIQEVQIVFLDWMLGPDRDQGSKKAAAKAARAIYEGFPANKKPIIVLMSDSSNLKALSNDFRKESNLIEGLFRAIPKTELRNAQSLALHVLALADALKPAHVVQMFTDAIVRRSNEAVLEFQSAVRDLSLSDYANIQHLSLRRDGHPLGDYMCWLFSGFLSDLLFGSGVVAERRLLDESDFEHMVPSPTVPSGSLAQIYHSAVFDMGVGPVADHPLAQADDGGRLSYPRLSLGDIFRRKPADPKAHGDDGTAPQIVSVAENALPAPSETASPPPKKDPERKQPNLYAIINAQCDLSSSPSQKRAIPADSSVLLVPGYVHALGEAAFDSSDSFTTPFFVPEPGAGSSWIEWKLGCLKTVEYGKFDEWLKEPDGGYERISRMRPLQALALQRELGDRNTRIGLPVTPPLYRKLTITLQFVDNKRVVSEMTDAEGWAIVIGSPASQKALIALATNCLQRVCMVMSEKMVSISPATGTARLTAGDIESALADADIWHKLLVPFQFDIAKGLSIFNEMLVFVASDKAADAIKSSKTLARILVHFDKGETG